MPEGVDPEGAPVAGGVEGAAVQTMWFFVMRASEAVDSNGVDPDKVLRGCDVAFHTDGRPDPTMAAEEVLVGKPPLGVLGPSCAVWQASRGAFGASWKCCRERPGSPGQVAVSEHASEMGGFSPSSSVLNIYIYIYTYANKIGRPRWPAQ